MIIPVFPIYGKIEHVPNHQPGSYSQPSARKNLCPRLHQENVDVLLHHRIYLLGGLDQTSKHMKEAYSYFELSQIMGEIWKLYDHMEHIRENYGKI